MGIGFHISEDDPVRRMFDGEPVIKHFQDVAPQNAMVENYHSVQQLKAEIAAVADDLERAWSHELIMCVKESVSKLRQLSAV